MLILGAADTIAACLLVRGFYDLPFAIPKIIIIFFAAYLLIKGVILIADIGSAFDLVGGILLLLSLANFIHPSILIFFAVLIGLKGILSLFSVFR
jgi:hypothetical protein